MSKKTILILITIVIVIGAVLGGIYFFKSKDNPTGVDTPDSGYKIFNPFGSSGGGDDEEGRMNGEVEKEVKETEKFYRLTDFAIAGAMFYEDKRVSSENNEEVVTQTIDPITKKPITPEIKFNLVPSLKYVERATGHIYKMELERRTSEKVSNTTIPTIYEAIFDKIGNSVVYRYISSDRKTIASFLSSSSSSKGEFLPSDILDVSVSPNKDQFFYLVKSNNGIIGVNRFFNNSVKTQIFTSPFTEWIPQWINDSQIMLTTKSSFFVSGNMFSLNIKTGVLTKVIGNINGLTTLSNSDGSRVLYSEALSVGPKLNIFNTRDNTMVKVDAYGLPEKCVWSKNNTYAYCAIPNTIQGNQFPDSWYQGLVSFDDSFIKIDTTNGNITSIIDSSTVTAVDATHLFLSENEDKLFFTNKKDSTLWGLDLY